MKKDLCKFTGLAIACVLGVFTAEAVAWSSLPQKSGDVEIAANTTVEIAASDVAQIESGASRVTSLKINSGATVRFTGDSASTLHINFPISGSGTFLANAKGTVVLNSDNSGLVAPGHFAFTNSLCVVSNEFGLGGKSTGPAWFYIGTSGDRDKYSLRFGSPNGVITNHVDIYLGAPTPSGDANSCFNFGSESENETLVMDASFVWKVSKNLNPLYLKGNIDFISGKFSSLGNGTSYHFYMQEATGHKPATVRFLGASVFESNYFFGANTKMVFGSSAEQKAATLCSGHYYCLGENFLPYGNFLSYGNPGPTIDLGGFDQKFKLINFANYNTGNCISQGGKNPTVVSSETPAQFSVGTKQTANLTWGFKFTGFAGYDKNFDDNIDFANYLSDSKGALNVSSGKLTMKWNAGWSDGTVNVTGGELICQSGQSIHTGKPVLNVSGTGKVRVYDGVDIWVSAANIGGVSLAPGIYTLAEIATQCGDGFVVKADGQSGSGALVVGGEQWNGWPASGVAYIPPNTTVRIEEKDRATVAMLDGIRFARPTSKVVYEFAGEHTLPFTLEGPGVFEFWNSGTVVIPVDNREFSGNFFFSNTTCCVSNEFGLGGVNARACEFHCGSADKRLNFGNGRAVFTNSVPVNMYLKSSSAAALTSLYFGSESLEETLVQDADVNFNIAATTSVNLKNNVKFLRKFAVTSTGGTYYPRILNDAGGEVWLLGTIEVKTATQLHCSSGEAFTLHLGLQGKGTVASAWLLYSNPNLIGECENFFADTAITRSQTFNLDLNGYNSNAYRLQHNNNDNSSIDIVSFYLKSAAPASLRITGEYTKTLTPSVSGVAGLTMAGTGNYTLLGKTGAVNTSTGELRVESGTLTLGQGFVWPGTNVVVTGGTLAIAASAGADAINRNSLIRLSSGAKLDLPEGKEIPVRMLSIDGGTTLLRAGTYGGSEAGLDAQHTLDCLKGRGTIKVKRGFSGSARLAIGFR